MVFTAKYLRCHVARSTAGVLVILLFELSANPEVSDPEVSLGIKDYIFWFDVAMNYLISVEVFEGYDEISEEELGLYLCESASASDMITEVSAVYVVHYEINVLSVLKGICHIDEKGVSDSRQKVPFVHDRTNGFFEDDFGFVHLFHGEDLPSFFELYLPYFTETTFADGIDSLELVEAHLNYPLSRGRYLNAHGFKLIS